MDAVLNHSGVAINPTLQQIGLDRATVIAALKPRFEVPAPVRLKRDRIKRPPRLTVHAAPAVQRPSQPVNFISKREIEVLKFLVVGEGNKVAASALNISVRTVEKHRQRVLRKLGTTKFTKVIHYALQQGWVENIYSSPLG